MTQAEAVFGQIRLKSCAPTFSATESACWKVCAKNRSAVDRYPVLTSYRNFIQLGFVGDTRQRRSQTFFANRRFPMRSRQSSRILSSPVSCRQALKVASGMRRSRRARTFLGRERRPVNQRSKMFETVSIGNPSPNQTRNRHAPNSQRSTMLCAHASQFVNPYCTR